MKANLVFCPSCKRKVGLWSKQLYPVLERPLGEVTPDGEFLIAPPGEIRVLITGPSFVVKCGHCGEVALKVERRTIEPGTTPIIGGTLLHWSASIGTFRVDGTRGETLNQGGVSEPTSGSLGLPTN